MEESNEKMKGRMEISRNAEVNYWDEKSDERKKEYEWKWR